MFTADCRLRYVTRDFVEQFHATPSSVGKDEMNTRLSGKNFAAGVIGNVLEWYDFAIYGYFAASIGRNFFPSRRASPQLLSAESKLG